MVDWMIEVLCNFNCDDLTFFLAVSMMDRYFDRATEVLGATDLHLIGVTAMFLASKYEDIFPLKMKTVFEKIGHEKIKIGEIKQKELQILATLSYKIQTPTALDFMKYYLLEMLDIHILSKTETAAKEAAVLRFNGFEPDEAQFESVKRIECDE